TRMRRRQWLTAGFGLRVHGSARCGSQKGATRRPKRETRGTTGKAAPPVVPQGWRSYVRQPVTLAPFGPGGVGGLTPSGAWSNSNISGLRARLRANRRPPDEPIDDAARDEGLILSELPLELDAQLVVVHLRAHAHRGAVAGLGGITIR